MAGEAFELFYAYARKDEALLNQLDTHLELLKREQYISTWHDRAITAGTVWAKEIDAHLKSAKIILLLISSDFLASDYCSGIEMKEAMRRHDAGEACVIPVILRACDWHTAPFGHLQVVPKNAKPVKMWRDRDEAYTNVAREIRRVIDAFRETAGKHATVELLEEERDAEKEEVKAKESPAQTKTLTKFLTMTPDQLFERYRDEAENLVTLSIEGLQWKIPEVFLFDNTTVQLPLSAIEVKVDTARPEYQVPDMIEGKANDVLEMIWEFFHDSTTIRLNALQKTSKGITLIVSKAHYKDYIGTNYAMDALLAQKGWKRSLRDTVHPASRLCSLEDSLLCNHIGVSTLVFTRDNYLAIPIRSTEKMATWQQTVGPSISGATSYDDDMYTRYGGPIASWIREGREELGVDNSDFTDGSEIFLGLTRDLLRGGKPEMFFATHMNITRTKLEQKFHKARDKWESIELRWLEFTQPLTPPTTEYERKNFLQDFLQLVSLYGQKLSRPAQVNFALWFKYMWREEKRSPFLQ